jgi:hypothetical protein
MPFGDLLDRNGGTHFHVGNAGNIGGPGREGLVETSVDLVEEPEGKGYGEAYKGKSEKGKVKSGEETKNYL